MAGPRLKGQEVDVHIMVNGVHQSTLTEIRSFSAELQLEVSSEGYLGQKTNLRDEVFNGVSGQIEMHTASPDWISLANAIKDRAMRKAGATLTVINIMAVLNYPSGDKKRMSFNDCSFGSIPVGFGSRSDFATISLNFECSDYVIL